MTNQQVLENKISAARKYLDILTHFDRHSPEQIRTDIFLRGALERYLYLAVQSTIDLSEGYIALRRLRKPSTYRECFDILHENAVIKDPMRQELALMVGFRNIIVHDYETVDFAVLIDILQKKTTLIRQFVDQMEALIQ